ncbi:hypothetical protein K458DRAFT_435095 [Lentithecium fluviatile CBS 122367]|uniref:Uncharacterized protein n=1 Tax=Lentithecium fluviatile CBS 122367 TaxID=1168545 RepID=A0A6G1IN05_9PLEO|nr:hypothetical protein K458DRAFT_435095 [Lentithecium fluviatile CBS 122367]
MGDNFNKDGLPAGHPMSSANPFDASFSNDYFSNVDPNFNRNNTPAGGAGHHSVNANVSAPGEHGDGQGTSLYDLPDESGPSEWDNFFAKDGLLGEIGDRSGGAGSSCDNVEVEHGNNDSLHGEAGNQSGAAHSFPVNASDELSFCMSTPYAIKDNADFVDDSAIFDSALHGEIGNQFGASHSSPANASDELSFCMSTPYATDDDNADGFDDSGFVDGDLFGTLDQSNNVQQPSVEHFSTRIGSRFNNNNNGASNASGAPRMVQPAPVVSSNQPRRFNNAVADNGSRAGRMAPPPPPIVPAKRPASFDGKVSNKRPANFSYNGADYNYGNQQVNNAGCGRAAVSSGAFNAPSINLYDSTPRYVPSPFSSEPSGTTPYQCLTPAAGSGYGSFGSQDAFGSTEYGAIGTAYDPRTASVAHNYPDLASLKASKKSIASILKLQYDPMKMTPHELAKKGHHHLDYLYGHCKHLLWNYNPSNPSQSAQPSQTVQGPDRQTQNVRQGPQPHQAPQAPQASRPGKFSKPSRLSFPPTTPYLPLDSDDQEPPSPSYSRDNKGNLDPKGPHPAPAYPPYSGKFKTSEEARAHRKRSRKSPKKADDTERVRRHGREYWVRRIYKSMIDISDIVDGTQSIHRQRFRERGFDQLDLEAAAHHIFDATLAVHERGWNRPLVYHKHVVRGRLTDVSADSCERRLARICLRLSESKATVDDAIRGGVTLALLCDNPEARGNTKLSNNKGNASRGERLAKVPAAKKSGKGSAKAGEATAETEAAVEGQVEGEGDGGAEAQDVSAQHQQQHQQQQE